MNPYMLVLAPVAIPVAMAGLVALFLIWTDMGDNL